MKTKKTIIKVAIELLLLCIASMLNGMLIASMIYAKQIELLSIIGIICYLLISIGAIWDILDTIEELN